MDFDRLAVPFNDLSRRFKSDVSLLASLNELILQGPYLKAEFTTEFEKGFGAYLGGVECVGVSSGTAALELALKSLCLPKGSAILMAANAGGYAAIAARSAGLVPYYVDVDEFGLIDITSFSDFHIGPAAIVATHLYGQACNMELIMNFASTNNLKVIEDCAQATGADIDGKRLGTLGHISAFSFYPTKNLGAIGDAGAVCTSDLQLFNRVQRLREYGWDKRYNSSIEGGGNYRIDEIQALVLSRQIPTLDKTNSLRQQIWAKYAKVCKNGGGKIMGLKTSSYIPHLAVIRTSQRERFIDHMKSLFIETAIHYPVPDYLQPGLGATQKFSLPVTEVFCREVVSVPLFPDMNEKEVSCVEQALSDFYKEYSD